VIILLVKLSSDFWKKMLYVVFLYDFDILI